MSFVRTVLGDIDPSRLGVCDAHEHVIIDPSFATANEPDFLLDDVDRAVEELREFYSLGGRSIIDTMPTGCGRGTLKLAEASRRSGVQIIVPTGVHLAKYYEPGSAILSMSIDELANMMIGEIETGINDDAGALPYRAGVIKIAGGRDRLSEFERNVFIAAAKAHRATGCPILTHTEQGTAVDEQIDLLLENGVDATRLTLSHTDRNPDLTLHRRWLGRGVNLEYDNHFRWKNRAPNPTVELIRNLIETFPNQLMVGMDAARKTYWRSHGGSPGLRYLLTNLPEALQLSRDLKDNLYVHNPAKAFSFTSREQA